MQLQGDVEWALKLLAKVQGSQFTAGGFVDSFSTALTNPSSIDMYSIAYRNANKAACQSPLKLK